MTPHAASKVVQYAYFITHAFTHVTYNNLPPFSHTNPHTLSRYADGVARGAAAQQPGPLHGSERRRDKASHGAADPGEKSDADLRLVGSTRLDSSLLRRCAPSFHPLNTATLPNIPSNTYMNTPH